MSSREQTELWIARISDYRASGERVAQWCERHQVTQHQLYYWMRKLRDTGEQQPASTTGPKWVSLPVESCANEETAPIRITVGTIAVEVRPGFDPAVLASVVRTLKALC
jgi:transposase-like protein